MRPRTSLAAQRIAHEEIVWKGTPTQIVNLGVYILCFLRILSNSARGPADGRIACSSKRWTCGSTLRRMMSPAPTSRSRNGCSILAHVLHAVELDIRRSPWRKSRLDGGRVGGHFVFVVADREEPVERVENRHDQPAEQEAEDVDAEVHDLVGVPFQTISSWAIPPAAGSSSAACGLMGCSSKGHLLSDDEKDAARPCPSHLARHAGDSACCINYSRKRDRRKGCVNGKLTVMSIQREMRGRFSFRPSLSWPVGLAFRAG